MLVLYQLSNYSEYIYFFQETVDQPHFFSQ